MTGPNLKHLGKYEIASVLGEGAMGIVYRAFDPVLNRSLAIKVMSSAIAADAALRERFLREARAAGSLQHPNVITVYDFGEAEGFLFIAMEFVDGADMAEIMKHADDVPMAKRLDMVIDVLNGLAYAHSRGLVHRDIKPANIRITPDGRAKIMDFGIAHLQSSELTQTGVMLGTPQYMAPEQVMGGGITAATDVFAVGTLLYEFLTGAKPFHGETLHEVMYKVMSEQPRPVRDFVPRIPAVVDTILLKALAKDPKDRYENALAMAKDLSAARLAITGSEDAAASEATLPGTVADLRSHVATAVRDPQLQSFIRRDSAVVREKRRLRIPWIVTGSVTTLAALAVIWMATRPRVVVTTPIPAEPAPAAASSPPAANPPAPKPDSGTVAKRTPPPETARQVETKRPTTPTPPPRTNVAAANARADSVVRELRATAMGARRQAQDAGATPSELTDGDSLVTIADALAGQGRTAEAAAQLSLASERWAGTERTARARAIAAAAAATPVPRSPLPVVPPPPPATPPESAAKPVYDARPDIERVIAAYTRAIESGNITEIRRAYPGLTTSQQQNWEGFFRNVRNFKPTLVISQLGAAGNTAIAEINAVYEYDNRTTGKGERQQLHLQAALARESSIWHITTIR